MAVGRGVRRGAHMSTKELARAACDGRRLSIVVSGVSTPLQGYLVGMDDFHLKIVAVSVDKSMAIMLIHKSASMIGITDENFLELEPEEIQARVESIGEPFRKFCAENHLGKSNKESQ